MDWDDGADDRIFTNDDTAVVGGDDHPEHFIGEFASDDMDLTSGFEEDHVQYNLARDLNGVTSIFLVMADLTKDSQITDPYDSELLDDLQGAFRSLICDSDLEIENSVYLPVFYEEE
jgi:hypothetical protein